MKADVNQKGFGLLEVVVGTAIITIAFITLLNVYSLNVKQALKNEDNLKAIFLAEEGLEAIRVMRDNSWSSNVASLPASTTRFLYFNGSNFLTTTTPEYLWSSHLRSFVVYDVLRNSEKDISDSGTVDSNTRRISVSVSWPSGGATSTKILESYLTNIFGN